MEVEQRMIQLIMNDPAITQKKVSELLSMNVNTVKYYFNKLKRNHILIRKGTSHKGQWLVQIQTNDMEK